MAADGKRMHRAAAATATLERPDQFPLHVGPPFGPPLVADGSLGSGWPGRSDERSVWGGLPLCDTTWLPKCSDDDSGGGRGGRGSEAKHADRHMLLAPPHVEKKSLCEPGLLGESPPPPPTPLSASPRSGAGRKNIMCIADATDYQIIHKRKLCLVTRSR